MTPARIIGWSIAGIIGSACVAAIVVVGLIIAAALHLLA
jgi:hypothetical protein